MSGDGFFISLMVDCVECGALMRQKHAKHTCCSTACYRRWKEKMDKLNAKPDEPPAFACPKCLKTTKLTFEPKVSPRDWRDFSCPSCGYCPMNPGPKDSPVELMVAQS